MDCLYRDGDDAPAILPPLVQVDNFTCVENEADWQRFKDNDKTDHGLDYWGAPPPEYPCWVAVVDNDHDYNEYAARHLVFLKYETAFRIGSTERHPFTRTVNPKAS